MGFRCVPHHWEAGEQGEEAELGGYTSAAQELLTSANAVRASFPYRILASSDPQFGRAVTEGPPEERKAKRFDKIVNESQKVAIGPAEYWGNGLPIKDSHQRVLCVSVFLRILDSLTHLFLPH